MTWIFLTIVAAVFFAGLFLRGRRHKHSQPTDGNASAGAEIVDDADFHKAINDLLKEIGERGA